MTYEKRESRKNYENLQLDESHHPHIIPCARAFRPEQCMKPPPHHRIVFSSKIQGKGRKKCLYLAKSTKKCIFVAKYRQV